VKCKNDKEYSPHAYTVAYKSIYFEEKFIMSLEISGSLVELRPVVTGESARGQWKKQEMIIETQEQFPKKVCLICWGDRVDEVANLQPGAQIKASINIESREFNGRWYTDVKVWRLETGGQSEPGFNQEPPPAMSNVQSNETTSFSNDSDMDDLPF